MLDREQYEQFLRLLPADITTSLKEQFRQKANVIEIQKGKTLFIENPENPKIFYILAGSCVRFIITPTGDEKAIMFHTESFIPVIGNLYINSEKSIVNYNLKANEHTKLIEINTETIYDLAIHDNAFTTLIALRGIKFISIFNQLQNHLIGLTSEDFFAWLISRYPFIFQRFLSKDIASFMGVTPVYLSNLKHKLLKK